MSIRVFKPLKVLSISFSLLLSCSVAFGSSLPLDVPEDHWAKNYIYMATKDNWAYINGNSIEPDKPATREHTIYMIISVWKDATTRGKTYGELFNSNVDMSLFKDVQDISSDVKENFEKALNAEIIKGYEDNTLKPKNNITRAEVATLLNRIVNIEPDQEKTIGFKDEIDDWCKDAIDNMVSAGIIKGYEDGTFKPSNNITNAEVVTMIARWVYGSDAGRMSGNEIDRLLNYSTEIGSNSINFKENKIIKQQLNDYFSALFSFMPKKNEYFVVDKVWSDTEHELYNIYLKNINKEIYDLIGKGELLGSIDEEDYFKIEKYKQEVEERLKSEYKKLKDEDITQKAEFITTDHLIFDELKLDDENEAGWVVVGTSQFIVRGILKIYKNDVVEQKDVEIRGEVVENKIKVADVDFLN